MNRFRVAFAIAVIILTALARIAPHPLNFTPAGALALFSGAHLRARRLAYLVPLVALLLGDLMVGFHIMMPAVYACFVAAVWIGEHIRAHRSKLLPVGGAVLAASVLFFVVTNFAWWALGGAYPLSSAGLAKCFVAGIPYFRNTLLGDGLYTAILFGGMALMERNFPIMQETPIRDEG